ncbi:MAG TPA: hypothetical protein VFU88_17010, partial [Ktedonobacterales bacterium]|nr:hypothetical protein [Ktedonobacterales bacterium]
GGQLGRLLLGEQLATQVAGLVGGALLGALALTATLPFLAVGETAGVAGIGVAVGTGVGAGAGVSSDLATLGVPPAVLAVDGWRLGLLGVVLVLACGVGLGLTALAARRLRLGQTLRLGDD